MHLKEDHIEQILRQTGEMDFPGFFVTAEVISFSAEYPEGYIDFLHEKYYAVTKKGVSGRIFSFRNNGWLIRTTFFPTDQVVEEKYALKNRVIREKLPPKKTM